MSTKLWFQVEQEIAKLLLNKLEHEQITPEKAIAIAQFVVKSIPRQMTDKEMLAIIPHLDDQFIELSVIVHKHMPEIDETKNRQRLDTARSELHKYLRGKL